MNYLQNGATDGFDLKRMGRATAVLGPVKEGWTSTDEFYPIHKSRSG